MPFHLYHFFAFVISAVVVLLTTPIVRRIGLKVVGWICQGVAKYTKSLWCAWAGYLSFLALWYLVAAGLGHGWIHRLGRAASGPSRRISNLGSHHWRVGLFPDRLDG
jgi:hypothetical protein